MAHDIQFHPLARFFLREQAAKITSRPKLQAINRPDHIAILQTSSGGMLISSLR